MQQTLLVGCSFLARLTYRLAHDDGHVNAQHYKILASPGSGNQALSARTIYEISQSTYQQVVVVWSGINRLDFPISHQLQRTYPTNKENSWVASCAVGSMAWYHSGGVLGTGNVSANTPKPLQQWFQTQYLGTEPSSRYLTDMSLLAIASCQGVLEQQSIPYKMAFIYDTQRQTQNVQHEHSLGQMDIESPLYNLVNWRKFTTVESPYEWAKRQNRLENDNYHPTRNAMIEWFDLAFDIDLSQ